MNETDSPLFNQLEGDFIDLMLSRRSTLARNIEAPGPDKNELMKILEAAARVPDHGKLAPWRFVILQKESQSQLSDVIFESIRQEEPEINELALKTLQQFPLQAPYIIAVISTPTIDCKIPLWEQHLSAGAVCQNILLAAASLGFAAQWLTGRAAYTPGVHKFFDMKVDDQIAGFIFIGSPSDQPLTERPRPKLKEKIDWL